MPAHHYDPADGLLSSGLNLAEPFTTAMALACGLDHRRLQRIVDANLLERPLAGVYHASTLADSLKLRVACVRLVVPQGCVVTDRTAGWLHGAPMTQAPNSHVQVPPVAVFHLPGNRLRNSLTASGERTFRPHDVVDVSGLRVTSALRTACDLGRLLKRDAAFAALDAMLRLNAFSHEQLLEETEQFKGFRGVRQLRTFAPLADAGSESFGESVLRLRWYDAGMDVEPETQVSVVRSDQGRHALLDVGTRRWRYAAEYDGERFHGPEQKAHDEERRAWLRDEGWVVDVFRRADVFGPQQSAIHRLRSGLGRAKVQFCAGSTY